MRIRENEKMPRPVVAVRGEFGDGVTELVARKVAVVAKHAHGPVLSVRVELLRHPDPAVARPVAANASVDVNGVAVHAAATARTVRDAIDRMVARIVRQLDDRPDVRRDRHARQVAHELGRAGAGSR